MTERYPTPKSGLDSDQLGEVTRIAATKLREKVDRMSHDSWLEGMTWYPTAHQYIGTLAGLYDIDPDRLAWGLALLSPQNRWDQNKWDLIDLIETGECGALKLGTTRAAKVLTGNYTGPEIAGGNKVRSFGWNLSRPYSSLDVTIDSHLSNVLELPYLKYLERKGVYHALGDAFRIVADEHGILPHQLQAALWIETRGDHK